MKALALILLAQLDGGASDVPRIVRLTDDQYMFNDAAVRKLDEETQRLQAVEAEHRSESWVSVLLVGMAVGLIVGIPVGVVATKALQK